MKKFYAIIVILCAVWPLANACAQEGKMKAAAVLTDKYAFSEAIKVYETLDKKNKRSMDLYKKLGDAYYFKNEPDNAIKWYREIFKHKGKIEPEYYYRLAQSLKTVGKYDEANTLLEQFSKMAPADERAELFEKNRNYLHSIENNSGRYKVIITDASSKVSDYGPAFLGKDKVVFASNRDSVSFMEKKDRWTDKAFTALYVAQISPKGNLNNVKKFSKNVQTKFHESTPAFTKDMKVMYFTRNNFNGGKLQKNNKDHILLKIYRAEADGDGWRNVKELPFTSNNYNTAHPCLSPDEKTLYFASDMPGGHGQSDIYKVSIDENGSFGTPENLGPGVNTEGKETFPFITEGKLYFASDGHPGLGGLDVFVAQKEADGSFKKSINVGEPINCHWDDFGFIINEETRMGYFTSNRKSGIGFDDIYNFTEYIAPDFSCIQFVSGILSDEVARTILPGTKVSLIAADGEVIEEVMTDDKARYAFPVECGQSYTIKAENAHYVAKEITVAISEQTGDVVLPIQLVKPEVPKEAPEPIDPAVYAPIAVGLDLAKKFHIEHIHFDLGKYSIRPDAAKQLDKIVAFMNEYPSAKIDIRSHTDSRGLARTNQILSENRSTSIILYLVKKGVARKRLVGHGFGESQLLTDCPDWKTCPEKEHEKNRRSEFIITEL